MRALRMIHETWARRVSVSLSAYLRTSVEVNLSDIDQGMYANFIQQLPDQGVFFIIGLNQLAGHFMLHVNADMAGMIVVRLLGGPGNIEKVDRRLTELEINLLRGTVDKLLGDLQDAWASVPAVRPHIDDISLNLLLVPIALPTDAIVWASFEVRAKGSATSMTLGMPYPVLKPVASQLSPYMRAMSPDSSLFNETRQHRQNLEAHLDRLRVPVAVQLGATEVSLEELAGLQQGDVLPLDLPTNGLCPVMINGSRKFMGHVGVLHRKLAVLLTDVVSEDGSSADDAHRVMATGD